MILYGHRGAKGEAPENTLPGFIYAYGIGVRAFELDVRLSADNELMVLHDATLDRTTTATGLLSEMTREQLSHIDARADFPDWPEHCRIPTLAEVLALFPGELDYELEIKRDDPARLEILAPKYVAAIEEFGIAERVTVTSFDPVALRIVRRLAPHLARGFIGKYDTPDDLATALELGCVQAAIPLATGSPEMVRTAHDHGLRVTGWQGDTVENLENLLAWQVDAITSNFPSLALSFLGGQK